MEEKNLEQMISWVYASLNHIETKAFEECEFQLERLERQPFDEGIAAEYLKACTRLSNTKIMILKVKEVLDSFIPRC